jgi:hypothetical protein
MARRLYRVSDEEWQRLAATRRSRDLAGTPPRASIGAIETELSSLDSAPPLTTTSRDSG